MTLQFLTDGTYDADKAIFLTPAGHEKHFVADDHLESPAYRALSPDDLFDIAVRHGLHFDQTREVGVVFNILASLAENGLVTHSGHGEWARLHPTRKLLDRQHYAVAQARGAEPCTVST